MSVTATCRCLQVMEGALGNIYISNPLYRPWPCQSRANSRRGDWRRTSGSAHTCWHRRSSRHSLFRLWNSLWWLFYQRSCPSPGSSRTGEDDPHFLKAKCSVLISRNELLVTRVNLLRPGRFIVSCHSWTHRADLYHSALSRTAYLVWTHMRGEAHGMDSSAHCSVGQRSRQRGGA